MKTAWHIPALRGAFGAWTFYPSLLTSGQIAAHVMPAKDIRESEVLDDYLQRDLKPRVQKIVRYLKSRDTRFFNAILLGVFDAVPTWVGFDLESVAKELDLSDISEVQESLGLLSFSGNEKIFAIDGQHRVEAIRKGNQSFLDRIQDDQFPVIFLSHQDSKEGKVRTRRLFCDINKNAVPVSKGDKVIIDEDDVCAVVTRRLYADYKRFRKGKEIAVTERIELVAKEGKEYFTSLLAVYTVCRKLKKLHNKAKGTLETDAENVTAFRQVVETFFEFIIKHEPTLYRYFVKRTTTPAKERTSNKNLAFRPIGLELLARLYVHFYQSNKLSLFAWSLENVKWRNPGGAWEGTVLIRDRIHNASKAKSAALSFVLYLVQDLPEEQVAALRDALRDWRDDDRYELPPRLKVPRAVLGRA